MRDLCGDDLIRRERKGLLYLRDRFLPYPPSAGQIVFAFGRTQAVRFIRDFVRARLQRQRREVAESFEDFTTASVGQSLYDYFYKPYVIKLYGRPPQTIAKDPAVSRVRKFTLASAAQELYRQTVRRRRTFLYPAGGIGQLSETMRQRFRDNGGTLMTCARVERLCVQNDRTIAGVEVVANDGTRTVVCGSVVISTIPLDVLNVLVALSSDGPTSRRFDLHWRGLRLLYLITPDKVPSEHETFYFPDGNTLFGRVSELRHYSPALNSDRDRAVLTIEIPCTPGDEVWEMSDEWLAERCVRQLQQINILRAPGSRNHEFFSHRLRAVYPVYDLGWRERFERIYARLAAVENLYLIGRSALFLHCNIDHCMAMALKLASHLTDGDGDRREWERIRRGFFEYRVRE
jgi:protoporphyrinogen oxidase